MNFGRDPFTLAERGPTVIGVDFSGPAIVADRTIDAELGLTERARFVKADLYDAPQAVPRRFGLVFINWRPDFRLWAKIAANVITLLMLDLSSGGCTSMTWRMFERLIKHDTGMYQWPA